MRLIGIGLIIILGTALYLFLHKSPTYHQGPVLNSTVIAFDYDGRHDTVTSESLINGDALIFLKIDPNSNKLELVSSFKQLQSYDGKRKGYIALDNPNFIDYYFGRYLNYSDTLEYRKLANSGIAGITLKYSGNKVTSARVILLDNSRRNLMMVKINSDVLEDVKLEKCGIKCDLPQ
ncbi:hypothetical protein [Legionella bononiensis]|uniref:Transmembrane protein n=1 Tax=Legionella bononiensis TaxID=2793102 RepID=A0ABS1WDH1_9GAMM|nr:hypothetical protein [Legionella bononiensis]MBL7481374.1 hypothetical protein [Legionella bononiensis]MBL7527406.1 hypothetical protein [Legionella bononiensis]